MDEVVKISTSIPSRILETSFSAFYSLVLLGMLSISSITIDSAFPGFEKNETRGKSIKYFLAEFLLTISVYYIILRVNISWASALFPKDNMTILPDVMGAIVAVLSILTFQPNLITRMKNISAKFFGSSSR